MKTDFSSYKDETYTRKREILTEAHEELAGILTANGFTDFEPGRSEFSYRSALMMRFPHEYYVKVEVDDSSPSRRTYKIKPRVRIYAYRWSWSRPDPRKGVYLTKRGTFSNRTILKHVAALVAWARGRSDAETAKRVEWDRQQNAEKARIEALARTLGISDVAEAADRAARGCGFANLNRIDFDEGTGTFAVTLPKIKGMGEREVIHLIRTLEAMGASFDRDGGKGKE